MRKFVLLLVLLLALPAAAMADDSQFIEHEPFALDDSWVEGSTPRRIPLLSLHRRGSGPGDRARANVLRWPRGAARR